MINTFYKLTLSLNVCYVLEPNGVVLTALSPRSINVQIKPSANTAGLTRYRVINKYSSNKYYITLPAALLDVTDTQALAGTENWYFISAISGDVESETVDAYTFPPMSYRPFTVYLYLESTGLSTLMQYF